MIIIDLHSKTPIYEQIKEQVMWLIRQGVYKPNEQLPSIRTLARDLSLNVNTVKRAFQELDAMGVTYSLAGRGVFINNNALENEQIKNNALKELKTALLSAQSRGLTKEEVKQLLEDLYDLQ